MSDALLLIIGIIAGGYLAFLISALITLSDAVKTSSFGEREENVRDYLKEH